MTNYDAKDTPGFKRVNSDENFATLIVSIAVLFLASVLFFGGFAKKRKRSEEIPLEENSGDELFTLDFHNNLVKSRCEVCLQDAHFDYSEDAFFEVFFDLSGPKMFKKQIIRSEKLCETCYTHAENSRNKKLGKIAIKCFNDFKKHPSSKDMSFDRSNYPDLAKDSQIIKTDHYFVFK